MTSRADIGKRSKEKAISLAIKDSIKQELLADMRKPDRVEIDALAVVARRRSES